MLMGIQRELITHNAGGNVTWYSHSGKVWQFLINLDMHLPYNPVFHIFKRKGNLYLLRNRYINVQNSYIPNSQKWGNNTNVFQKVSG